MLEFHKKPILFEAVQMTKERRLNNADWPDWLKTAWNLERGTLGSLYPTVKGTKTGTLSISALEGKYRISRNDWIIRGVTGEIYSCKEDIFKLTYDIVK